MPREPRPLIVARVQAQAKVPVQAKVPARALGRVQALEVVYRRLLRCAVCVVKRYNVRSRFDIRGSYHYQPTQHLTPEQRRSPSTCNTTIEEAARAHGNSV